MAAEQQNAASAPPEPDRLTQLQNAFDQFTVQCYSALHYLNNHHDMVVPDAYVGPPPPPGEKDTPHGRYDGTERGGPDNSRPARPADLEGVGVNSDTREWIAFPEQPKQTAPDDNPNWKPEDRAVFKRRQTELAKDLVLKTKQIEMLILSLPGVGVSEEDQERRLRGLEERLRKGEEERERSVKAREEAREKLDELLGSIRRV